MTKLVFALVGTRRSGKTTLATWFQRSFKTMTVSVTAPIRTITGALWGLSADQLEGDAKDVVDPRYGRTPRDLMLHTSAVLREHFGRAVWAERAAHSVAKGPPGVYVVDGIRGAHEVEVLRAVPDARVVVVVTERAYPDPPALDEIDRAVADVTPDVRIAIPTVEPQDAPAVIGMAALEALLPFLNANHDILTMLDPGEAP